MISHVGHYEPVAREGIPFVVVPAVISALAWWYSYPWVSLLFLLISLAIAAFFRNPERIPPSEEGIVVSPADGRVVEIVRDASFEYIRDESLTRVSIFMSIFNVHVNRAPITGRVQKIAYRPGGFLDAREPEASKTNEQNAMILKGSRAIGVVQVAGKIARRIACWISEGDEIRLGDRFGLIRFGSRLDVYLPQDFTITVEKGNRVRAGETIIARFSNASIEKSARAGS